jgi:DNA-binding winged helix-turn-helix (wHTH) protein
LLNFLVAGQVQMSSPTQFRGTVSFGEFELDVETAELRNNGSKAVLPGQPFQILVTLLGRPGQLITREELKKQLWPSDTFVDFDVSLNKAVNRLREALGDSAEHPRFIETLPRKGYRFIGVIENGTSRGLTNSADRKPVTDRPVPVKNRAITTDTAHHRLPLRATALKYALGAVITIPVVALVSYAVSKWLKSHHPDLSRVQITKLTDSGNAHEVAISPDGRYVIYSLSSGEKESLRLRQVATRSDVEILPPGPGFHGLTFSPDGNYVYFVRSDANEPYFKYLYSVPLLGGPVRRMIADVDSPVTFSANGEQFAFERAVVPRNVIELRIADADGSREHVIATIENGDAGLFQPGPSWSRDGRTIVCPFRIHAKGIRWILTSVSVPNGQVREIYSDSAAQRAKWLLLRPLSLGKHQNNSALSSSPLLLSPPAART